MNSSLWLLTPNDWNIEYSYALMAISISVTNANVTNVVKFHKQKKISQLINIHILLNLFI